MPTHVKHIFSYRYEIVNKNKKEKNKIAIF